MNKKIKFLPLACFCLCGYLTACNNFWKDKKEEDAELYLPERIEYYNGYLDSVYKTVDFTYHDDFLGYTKTTLMNDGEYEYKTVEDYTFNSDFSESTSVVEEFDFDDGKWALSSKAKFTTKDTQNQHVECVYYFDFDIDNYFLYYERTITYNDHGRVINESRKDEDEGNPGTFYISELYTYEYDSEGFLTKQSYSCADDDDKTKLIEVYYDIFSYNENHTHGKMETYYRSKTEEFELESYIDINITFEDGLKKFDEQIYFTDDSLGNHNIFWYNEDFERVYLNYGDGREEMGITYNDDKQITEFFMKIDELESIHLIVNYDSDGKITTSNFTQDNQVSNTVNNSTYSHNEYGQLSAATAHYLTTPKDPMYGDVEDYIDTVTITFTELQNNDLLKNMYYEDDVITYCSLYIMAHDENL